MFSLSATGLVADDATFEEFLIILHAEVFITS